MQNAQSLLIKATFSPGKRHHLFFLQSGIAPYGHCETIPFALSYAQHNTAEEGATHTQSLLPTLNRVNNNHTATLNPSKMG